MQLNRKVDLSVYYFLDDLLPDLVTVYDGYPVGEDGRPSGDLIVPSVASVRQPIVLRPFELAGLSLAWYYYIIDVYASTKAQRDDIAYLIQTNLDSDYVPIYDYDEGFPPLVSPSRLGTLVLTGDITSEVVYVFSELTPKKYWRALVDFSGYYNPT